MVLRIVAYLHGRQQGAHGVIKWYPVPLKLMALQLGYDLRMFEIPTNGKNVESGFHLLLQECHPMSDYELRGAR